MDAVGGSPLQTSVLKKKRLAIGVPIFWLPTKTVGETIKKEEETKSMGLRAPRSRQKYLGKDLWLPGLVFQSSG